MYKNKTFLAIIPARGGSKGIFKKNIARVNNMPLIQYTIETSKRSKYLDEILVSTDSAEIAKVCESLDVNIPFLRPAHLATDSSKTIDAVIHVIDEFKTIKKEYDYIVLLQPTQPLREPCHIDEAITMIIDSKRESLLSITEINEHPILMRTLDDKNLLSNILNVNSTVRRQDLPKVYKVNGSIYINQTSAISANTSLNDNVLGYLMDKKYDLDIDVTEDLKHFNDLIMQENREN